MVGLIVVKYKGHYGTISQVWDHHNTDDATPIVSIVLSHLFLCSAVSAYGLRQVVLEYWVVGWVSKWDGTRI